MKIKVDRLDHQGRGISSLNEKIIFIPKTLPGEEIETQIIFESKKYREAILKKVLTSSPKRVKSECPYFNKCGGCHLRHVSYEETLDFKKSKLENILKIKIDEIIPSNEDNNYRNKITLKVKDGKVGYYEEKSHTLIEIDNCPNAKKSINKIIPLFSKINMKNGEVVIRSNYNNEILLSVTSDEKLDFNILESEKIVGIIQNEKIVYGLNHFIEIINGLLFKVSYKSFFQINNSINSKLFNLLNDNILENKTVLDLYCGVGTLGISIAKKVNKVIGIDNSESNIKDALINAKMNKLNNVFYMLGDASKLISKINDKIDTVIVDPPRNGLNKEGIKSILSIMPEEIIYISCDPMTLARDLNILKENYKVDKAIGLDMFPYTHHIETIIILKKA